jgi:spermidine synthase
MTLALRARTLALAVAAATPIAAQGETLLFDEEGRFGRVRVTEEGGLATLSIGDPPTPQSAGRREDPSWLEYEYARLAMTAALFVPAPRRALVVGLGGGSIQRFVRWMWPECVVDSVEIDAAVVRAARAHFGVDGDPRHRIHVDDGRAFVERAKDRRWDVVVLDAYAPDYIPPALGTLEFFRLVRERLAPGGVVVANVWGPPNPIFEPFRRTLRAAFSSVAEFAGRVDRNHMLVGVRSGEAPGKDELVARAARARGAHPWPFDLAALTREAFAGYLEPAGEEEPILRDERPRPGPVPVPR